MNRTGLLVRAIVPLTADLIVDASAAGSRLAMITAHGAGQLVMPCLGAEDFGPLAAPEGFARVSHDWGTWTSRSGSTGQLAVPTVGFELTLESAALTFPVNELGNAYARGPDPVEEDLLQWLRRLQEWGQILARQSLSPLEPSPKTLSAASSGLILWVETSGRASWPGTSQLAVDVVVETAISPLSERVADTATLTRMAAYANNPNMSPPPAVNLLAAARRAAQRGQWRLALMELGTALEAVLTSVLQPTARGFETLGPMTSRAIREGIALPADIDTAFVKPRNAAVHHGATPSVATVIQALDLLDALIATYHADYAADPSLPLAHRVQRHDLHIVRPPGP